MGIINEQDVSPKQWNVRIICRDTPIGDLASDRPHWVSYLADKPNLDGVKLKAALDEFAEVGLCQSQTRLIESPTMKRKFVHIDTEDDEEGTSAHRSLPMKFRS
ncbi:hypothetical protein BDD12DRAFT_802786 [Trichophaea hybrida]|nr:hypothetical protein BDD12DRAFT_802786 [Trichophaea hybrida]